MAEGVWPRILTFIEEERDCCPFLAFAAMEAGQYILLSVFLPEAGSAEND